MERFSDRVKNLESSLDKASKIFHKGKLPISIMAEISNEITFIENNFPLSHEVPSFSATAKEARNLFMAMHHPIRTEKNQAA